MGVSREGRVPEVVVSTTHMDEAQLNDAQLNDAYAKKGSLGTGERPVRSTHVTLAEIDEIWPDGKYTAYALFRAWLFIMFNTTIFSTFGESPVPVSWMQAVFTPTIALTGLLLALFSPKRPALLSAKAGWPLSAAATVGLACALAAPVAGGAPLFVAGTLCAGVGAGWVTVRCAMMFVQMPTRLIFMRSAAGEALAYVIYFFVTSTPAPISLASLLLLPAAATLCLALDQGRGSDNPHAARLDSAFPRDSLVRFIAVLVILAVAGALSRESLVSARPASDLTYRSQIRMGGACLIALGVLVFVSLSRRRVSFWPMYCGIVVVEVAVLMLIPLFGITLSYGSIFISMLFLPFKLLAWCMFCGFSRYWSNHSVQIIGLSSFGIEIGTVVGWALSQAMLHLRLSSQQQLVVCMVLILVLVIAAFTVFREGDMRRLNGRDAENEPLFYVASAGTVRTTVGESPEAGVVPAGSARSAAGAQDAGTAPRPPCSEVSGTFSTIANPPAPASLEEFMDAYRLSRREREVFSLLVRGRDTGYVAEALCISRNTVKTHAKNIYAKLGIGGRQEMFDIVDSFLSGDKNAGKSLG